MAKHINAAYRVHRVLSDLRAQPGDSPTFETWARVLGITDESPTERRHEVDKRRTLFVDQVSRVREAMRGLDYSDELFASLVDNLRQQIVALQQDRHWKDYLPQLSGELLLALAWCSEVLPHEEEIIDADRVREWVTRIEELMSKIQASQLPPELRRFVMGSLSEIRDALRSYQITGLKTIEGALLRAQGDANQRAAGLKAAFERSDAKGKELLGEFRAVIDEVGTAADTADQTRPPDEPKLGQFPALFGHVVPRT